jgi:hypothetical protein
MKTVNTEIECEIERLLATRGFSPCWPSALRHQSATEIYPTESD